MTTIHDEDQFTEPVIEEPDEQPEGSSVLAQIKQRRHQFKADRRADFVIPGYGGLLYGRFKPIDIGKLKKAGETVDKIKSPRADLIGATDTLIAGLEMFVARDPDNPKADAEGFVPLHEYPELGLDVPVAFDDHIIEWLGLPEAKTARQIVWRVIPEDLAVMNLYADVIEWQSDLDREADGAVEGESEGAR